MTRIAELTAKLLDGTLTEPECGELEALLATDPGAEAEHLALLELEAELRGLRTDFDLADATLATIQKAHAERTAQAVLTEIASAPPPVWAERPAPTSSRQGRRRIWVGVSGLLVCAAALLLGLWLNPASTIPPRNETPSDPAAFATLSRKTGSVEVLNPAGEAIPAEEGASLPAGFTLRTIGDDSLAIVELLHDQARVEIEPDSVVRFAGNTPQNTGKPQLFLAAGQLTAAVPQRPDNQPLIVGTAVAEVFAREGTFVVSSAGPDSARVDIKQGKVELVRATTPKPVPLGVGGAAVVFAGVDHLDLSAPAVDRTPKRMLAFPGPRAATFSRDGSEVWVANARLFTRWLANGSTQDIGFYQKRGYEGIAAFSRDKRYLVACRNDRDDRVLVRTLPDGGEHAAINARPTDPRFWTIAPDVAWLAMVDPKPNNKRLRLFDGGTGDERFMRVFDEVVGCVASAPGGRALAVGLIDPGRGVNNKVLMLDTTTGDRLFALPTQKKPITALQFSDDGRYLAAGFNGMVQLWDLQTHELIRSFTGFERPLTCLAFSPDGMRLAAGTHDGHVWLWQVNTGRQTQLIDIGSRGLRSLAFSPDGKQIVTVANAVPVAVWDVADRSLLHNLE